MSAAAPMIEVRDLRKSFGPNRAVDGVSFAVDRGEVVGFLGPNGAGKTTTMRILTGFLAPDGGSARIGGEEVAPERAAARRRIGYLPESTPLYRGMRVSAFLEFVADARGLPRSRRRAAFERAFALCGLEGHARRRIRTLSKGYRQRVGLAQALLSDPEVLVLDEPTSGLDPVERVRIRELVRDLGRERTVLLSTHVLAEVQACAERVVILSAGRVVADGTPLELASEELPRLFVVVGADAEPARAALAALAGVRSVEGAGADRAGRVAFRLELEGERFELAASVGALASERGWPLYELAHAAPTLESVFLSRAAAEASADGGAEA